MVVRFFGYADGYHDEGIRCIGWDESGRDPGEITALARRVGF